MNTLARVNGSSDFKKVCGKIRDVDPSNRSRTAAEESKLILNNPLAEVR